MNIDELLESIGCPFSEHEVQGYMIGLLSQNLKDDYKNELDSYLKYLAKDKRHQETINNYTILLLKMLMNKKLMASYDNESSIEEKILALSDWTRHFYMSLSVGLEKRNISNDMELQSIMHDFDEIGNINQKYSLNDMENNKKHYNNIKEYIEKSVYRMFDKMREK
tara:strand:+ start:683 stop:1180 length:498 start_codon:yes stop_codon:yes gene_type:complete